MEQDYFRMMRKYVEGLGYKPTERRTFPGEYCKDGYYIRFSLEQVYMNRFRNVYDLRKIVDGKVIGIGATRTLLSYQFDNIPLTVMKRAIKNPEKAIVIFNNWETKHILKDL